jgi:hypothetical protein
MVAIPKYVAIIVATAIVSVHHHATDAAVNNVVLEKPQRGLAATSDKTTTYIISFADDEVSPAKRCAALARSTGSQVQHVYEHALNGCSLTLPVAQTLVAFMALSNDPSVEYAEVDRPMFINYKGIAENIFYPTTSHDILDSAATPSSWGLDRINQCELPLDSHVTKQDAAGVYVFIIDTGINADHEEFANGVIGPEDCHFSAFSYENALSDGRGHGYVLHHS